MSSIVEKQTKNELAALPLPKIPISVRTGTMGDVAFMDALQKKHSKQLGFFPRSQIEAYLKNEWALVAEEHGVPTGYILWRDRYQKRDELGAVFQLCVSDQVRRKLVGAMLVKCAFERSAYGCKLFCCWCAQDIEANHFWEAMGFVPLAFRTGSRGKGRIHIFWQRRIRAGDTTTAWWFPSQTQNGAVREDRIVLPIPPGTHWSDAKPIVLPGAGKLTAGDEGEAKALPVFDPEAQTRRAPHRKREKKVVLPPSAIVGGGLRFGPIAAVAGIAGEQTAIEKPTREKAKAPKNDPKLIAAARELRDRWLEEVNAGNYQIEGNGKYDVSRCLTDECGAGRETEKAERGAWEQIEGAVVSATDVSAIVVSGEPVIGTVATETTAATPKRLAA